MAGKIASDKSIQKVSGFPLGMDNTSPEERMPTNEFGIQTALRDALNVDITKEGTVLRRAGFVKRLDAVDPQVFAHPEFPFMLARSGTLLQAIDPDLAATTVASNLGDAPVSVCELNGELCWTVENERTGRLDSMLRDLPLGLPTPAGVPGLSLGSNGGLFAGNYRVALSYLDEAGEESGTCAPAAIDVPADGAIVVALVEPPTGVAATRIYVTDADDATLLWVADVFAGFASYTIQAGDRGDAVRTQGLQPLPAGHILRESNGVLWMAVGNRIVYGEPGRPRLHHPGKNYIPYTARIDMVEPVGEGESAGVFVGAGTRIYYHQGGVPRTVNMRMPRLYGAVPGTSRSVPGELFGDYPGNVAYWMGKDGSPCLGLPGGTIKVLAKRVAMTQFERGATLVREINGMRQVVTAGVGSVGNFAAADTAEVYQYRNGIPVP